MIIEVVEKLLNTEFRFCCCLNLRATVIVEKAAISFSDAGLVPRLTCEHYSLHMAHFPAQAHSSLHTTSCGF